MKVWTVVVFVIWANVVLASMETGGNTLVEKYTAAEISFQFQGEGWIEVYERSYGVHLSMKDGYVNGSFWGYGVQCTNRKCKFETQAPLIRLSYDGIGYVCPYDGRSECQIVNNQVLIPGTIKSVHRASYFKLAAVCVLAGICGIGFGYLWGKMLLTGTHVLAPTK